MLPKVYIIDGNLAIRGAYAHLTRSSDLEPVTFCSIEEFLSGDIAKDSACVITDVELIGKSGLELPGLLAKRQRPIPVIIVTADATSRVREAAQRAGVAAFFQKPIEGEALLDAIAWALTDHCQGARKTT